MDAVAESERNSITVDLAAELISPNPTQARKGTGKKKKKILFS